MASIIATGHNTNNSLSQNLCQAKRNAKTFLISYSSFTREGLLSSLRQAQFEESKDGSNKEKKRLHQIKDKTQNVFNITFSLVPISTWGLFLFFV